MDRDPKTFDYTQAVSDAFDSMSDEEFQYVMGAFSNPVKVLEQYGSRHVMRWFAVTLGFFRLAYTKQKELEAKQSEQQRTTTDQSQGAARH